MKEVLQSPCTHNGDEILEGHLMPDYIHAGKYPIKSQYNEVYLVSESKSPLMIFDNHANLKYKFGNRKFLVEGYYVSTIGLNGAMIKKYIQQQEIHAIV